MNRALPVEVYRNLRKNCWSIRQNGRVVLHLDEVYLDFVRFKVSEAGRQRVLRERRKNVHAVVVGRISSIAGWGLTLRPRRVRYNPYRAPTFINDRGRPVHAAARAFLDADGAAWVLS